MELITFRAHQKTGVGISDCFVFLELHFLMPIKLNIFARNGNFGKLILLAGSFEPKDFAKLVDRYKVELLTYFERQMCYDLRPA